MPSLHLGLTSPKNPSHSINLTSERPKSPSLQRFLVSRTAAGQRYITQGHQQDSVALQHRRLLEIATRFAAPQAKLRRKQQLNNTSADFSPTTHILAEPSLADGPQPPVFDAASPLLPS